MLKSADGALLHTFDLKTKSSPLSLKTKVKDWFFRKHFKAARKYEKYAATVAFYQKGGAAAGSFKILTKAAMDEYEKSVLAEAAAAVKK